MKNLFDLDQLAKDLQLTQEKPADFRFTKNMHGIVVSFRNDLNDIRVYTTEEFIKSRSSINFPENYYTDSTLDSQVYEFIWTLLKLIYPNASEGLIFKNVGNYVATLGGKSALFNLRENLIRPMVGGE